jgi:hypothetical protein
VVLGVLMIGRPLVNIEQSAAEVRRPLDHGDRAGLVQRGTDERLGCQRLGSGAFQTPSTMR